MPANLGYHLALIDIDVPGLTQLQKELAGGNRCITIHPADVSKEEDIISVRTDIVARHGRVDILVNNAAISNSQPFDQVEIADFTELFNVNFWGTVHCTKHFLQDLKKGTDSKLVNIISGFAGMGFPGKTTYGSSKSAVMGFTYALKTELEDTTVKVCLVIPPPLDTGLVKKGKHIDEERRRKEAVYVKRNGISLDMAARRIVKQIGKGRFRIVVGPGMYWMDLAARLFPTMVHRMIGKNKHKFDFI